jgi:hypothetical protein
MLENMGLQRRTATPPQVSSESSDLARMRVSLARACKGFRRLGNGSFALAGFIWIAFLTALFAGQLTLLPALIGGAGGLFLALVGYVFHMQADNIDLGGSNDHF